MYRYVFLMLTAVTVAGCKTNGLIPGKFEGGTNQAIERFVDMIIAALK